MRITPDHVLSFEWVDDTKIDVPQIESPMYIPRVDEHIKFVMYTGENEKLTVVATVVELKYLVHNALVGEQEIIVSLKLISQEKGKLFDDTVQGATS